MKERTRQLEIAIADLSSARDAANSANLAKSEFLANMSHEIRTPMNAILGMVNLALPYELPAKVRQYLEVVRASGHNLLAIINDILDLSKIDAGKLVIEQSPFNLRPILDNLANLFAAKLKEKHINFVTYAAPEVPDGLVGDSLRLGQVLINLISNAGKFTETGEISLRVDCRERSAEGAILQFSVRDTGIGLEQATVDTLFEPFNQADTSTTRKYGGTGLGLSICKKLVTMMGGRIWAESLPGQGSTFSFAVQLGVQSGESMAQGRLRELQGLRILLVDDEPDFLEMLADLLTLNGMTVVTASLSAEAMTKLHAATTGERPPFDLLILDLMMPGQDGIATAKAIRGDRRFAGLPIMIMTGVGREVDERRAKEAGVNAFLFKPFDPQVLLETIAVVLAESRPPGGAAMERQQASNRQLSSKSFQGCRVLLVEDNTFNQMVAMEILQQFGILVEVANNGREAAALAGLDFDLVFMDIQMPEMDGLEATRLIRDKEGGAKIPIIAMTAHAMDGYREKCLTAGMDEYISKPFEPAEILAVMGRFIGTDAAPPVEEDTDGSVSTAPEEVCSAIAARVEAHLADAYRFDSKKIKKIVLEAKDSLHKQLANGEAALASGDMVTFRRSCHTIKGTLRTLGLGQWGDLAEKVEKFQPGPNDEISIICMEKLQ